jgi:hypothetical protein
VKPAQIIASLNSITVGEMDGIRARLDEAKHACLALQQVELAGHLDEAGSALERADMKTYHRRVATVVAQLGHLK